MQKYQDVVLKPDGSVIQGASVLVQSYPGAVTSTIYSDDGVTVQANPMTTDSLGSFGFYAAGGTYQLVISGSQIATKTITGITLDEGTTSGNWTPAFSASGCTFVYAAQAGYYTKAGNLVTLQGQITLSTGNTLASADLKISGLPFASAVAGPAYVGGGSVPQFTNLGAGVYGIAITVAASSSDIEVWSITGAFSNATRANASVVLASNARFDFILSYRSAT